MISPNTSVVISTTPMCSELMLPSSFSLMTIGMKMMIAGTASMKSPITMNSSTSSSMMMRPSWPATISIQPDTMSGPRR